MTNRQIGYFTLVFLVVFVTVFGLYVHFTYVRGWTVRTVYADNIGNLKIDNPVKVAGVAVGMVRSIGREGNKALLRVKMRDDLDIRTDYALLNMDVGLMGDRILVLVPGKSGEPLPADAPLNARFLNGIAEGIRNADLKVPKRVLGDPPLQAGETKGITVDLAVQQAEYFAEMGWSDDGVPSKETLQAVGLDFVVPDIHG